MTEATVTPLRPAAEAEPALPKERCGLCRFWNEDEDVRDEGDPTYGFGQCRLHPPVIIGQLVAARVEPPAYGKQVDLNADIHDVLVASLFPVTHSLDWCGDFRVKPEDEPISV